MKFNRAEWYEKVHAAEYGSIWKDESTSKMQWRVKFKRCLFPASTKKEAEQFGRAFVGGAKRRFDLDVPREF